MFLNLIDVTALWHTEHKTRIEAVIEGPPVDAEAFRFLKGEEWLDDKVMSAVYFKESKNAKIFQ